MFNLTVWNTPESACIHAGVVLMVISLFSAVWRSLVSQNSLLGRVSRELSWFALALSLVVLGVSLYFRSITAAYFALSNMYESLLVVVMFLQLSLLVVDRRYPVPMLNWLGCLFILGTLAYNLTLPTDIRPLQAALQSYWRAIHVPVILSSYALFTLSFLTSLVYLIKAYTQPHLVTETAHFHNPDVMYSTQDNEADNTQSETTTHVAAAAQPAGLTGWLQNIGPLALYDEITYRVVLLGFPLLTIGIILGGLWANEAWGNYWSWDPKESMSLVTLLGYGVYLHLRVNGQHSAKLLSWVSVACFALLLLTYFGVNIMGVGLHSYGKIG